MNLIPSWSEMFVEWPLLYDERGVASTFVSNISMMNIIIVVIIV